MRAKSLVIAGNGTSLSNIDYARLPLDFDLYRCNQFFFEDKYYLGSGYENTESSKTQLDIAPRSINVFGTNNVLAEYYYTLHHVLERGEYKISHVFIEHNALRKKYSDEEIKLIYPKISPYNRFFTSTLREWGEYLAFNEFFRGFYLNTGTTALSHGVWAGYKEFYLAGIDFYDDGAASYAFGVDQPNFVALFKAKSNIDLKRANEMKFKHDATTWHKKIADVNAMKFLEKTYGVKIYCLSQSSGASEHFPLAPIVRENVPKPKQKPSDYVKDFILPTNHFEGRLVFFSPEYKAKREVEKKLMMQKERQKQRTFKGRIQKLCRSVKKRLWWLMGGGGGEERRGWK